MPNRLTPPLRLIVVFGLLLIACGLFLTLNQRAGWAFTLAFRGEKLLGLLLVAWCIAVATVLFQTLTNNRILSPGIMGFDVLYLLLQSLLLYHLGALFFTQLNPSVKWLGDVALMVGVSCLLYYWLFIRQQRHLHVVVLVGIILGTLFRSLNSMITRMMDPVDFELMQDVMFASFNQIDTGLLGISAGIGLAVSLIGLVFLKDFDVLALGRAQAINLGLKPRRLIMSTLVGIAILVSISTALVGPVTFFGLLVANLAYLLAGSHQHRFILPMAFGIAAVILIAGQAILEHLLHFATGLSVIIEFVGGIFFLFLILKQGRK